MTGNGVTIAIPNWNRELLLPRSVTSALTAVRLFREQNTPAEVLVIDDGSRDGSLTLLRQLEAFHVRDGLRVLARPAPAGLAEARNLALERARQRYVVFMDAGNELLPRTTPLFRRALVETGAAAAYGNLIVRRGDSGPARTVINNESFQRRMFRHNQIAAFAMVDRLQLLDGGGYSASLPSIEEYEQWLHLACNGKEILFVPLVFGYYDRSSRSNRAKADERNCDLKKLHARRRRTFDECGARRYLGLTTLHRRYYPALGYL